uniref:Ricin B lectin domain-containing protein n=1 Tax=Arundo donax TaxID=35708 RepID=A0A0A9CQG1_ARUDO
MSLEKCLAAAGTTPGSSVFIHECDTLDESAVQWVMLYSGTLENKHSGLVLTATDGSGGSKLTLEEYSASSFQAWKHTNNLNAVDVYIRGENNQCIYYNGGYGVYTETCSKGSSRQIWRLYPDSTVRPKDWLDGCLELESLSGDWIYVQAGYCSSSPELHRWIFAHDGSIKNWKTKLVVDASKTYPGRLYAWPYGGSQNQIWTLEFI